MVAFRFSLLCSAAVFAFAASAAPASLLAPEPSLLPFESPEPTLPPFVTAIPIPTRNPVDELPVPSAEPIFGSPEPIDETDLPQLTSTPALFDDTIFESAEPTEEPSFDETPQPAVSPIPTHMPHVSPISTPSSAPTPSGTYDHHNDHHNDHKSVCFFKKQKCCYKFKPCGHEVKKVKLYVPFTCKVCHPKKIQKCHYVPKKLLTEECKYEKIEIPCKHDESYGYKKCEPKYVTKKVCCDKWIVKHEKVCKYVVKKECKHLKGKQIVFKFYKYTKYCPKLICGEQFKEGNYKKPEQYLSKSGKFVKEMKGKKITVDAKTYEN